MSDSYDYVIVGGGSAGCVLANRLSEDPDVSVLLVEAGGPDTSDFIHIPAAFAALMRSGDDWDHSSGYEPGAKNRRIYLPRGKVLGGSSSINAMIYIRGSRHDWDEWEAAGCDGWGYDAMLPYFLKAEGNRRTSLDPRYHAFDGPLTVSDHVAQDPLSRAFIDAASAAGHQVTEDFNAAEQQGVGWYQTTTDNGVRASTAVSYLRPAQERPNLTVETDVLVAKVVFDGTRATGVAGLRHREEVAFDAGREVIVCGGAYNSPQLLTLSGLGRAEELEELLIPQVAAVPELGMNLSDHPNVWRTWSINEDSSLFGALTEANLEEWQAHRGLLTTPPGPAGGFFNSRDGEAAPDLQFHFVPALFEQEALLPGDRHGMSLATCLLKPRSRGQVSVVSPDPGTKPYIVHGYLTDEDDLRRLIAGVREIARVAEQAPMARLIDADRAAPDGDSDAELEEFVRSTLHSLYHPVGTCRMGSDDTSVVDPELRVRGVDALRVVDASVFPDVPRGNTNAPVIALAERAADLIRGGEGGAVKAAAVHTEVA